MSDFESGSTATFPAPGAGGRMVAGDFDGDGDADILYQTGGNGSAFQYARSNGDGTFTILSQASSPLAGLTLPDNGAVTHYAGDFDGDGDIDLIVGVPNVTASFFRNNGNGTFTSVAATLPAAATGTRWVTGDFDGDGDEDILYQTGANGTAFQYARSNGDGTFTILSQASSPFAGVTLVDHNGSNYISGDFDGDGDVDLIGTANGTSGEYYRNDGAFAEGDTATFPQPAAGGRMTAGDFDADGDTDILFQTGANGTAFQYARSNGDGTFSILSLASSPFAGLTLPDHSGANYYAADFDGDGDTDLLVGVNSTTGSYFYQVGKPPELASSTPADNATGVAVNANITLVFDEAVTKGNGDIYIVRSDGTLIETISVNSAQVTGSGTTWTIDPSVTLSGLTSYSVQLEAGTFKDTGGAIFAGIDDDTTINFTTVVVNTPPTQGANAGLTLSEGATGTITAARLDFNDAQQADTAITYTLTTLATNGTLRLNGGALGLNGTFTQDDINNNRVTYLHNGSETTSAAFGFSVSDGAGGSVTGRTFTFTITPVNDAPVHSLPATVSTAEDAQVGLNGGVALDPTPVWIDDVDSATITTTLSAVDGSFAAIAQGSAIVGGAGSNIMTVTGSVADVNKTVYYASYTPALDVNGTRTITVTTSDGSASDSDTITVNIAAMPDAPEGADGVRPVTEDTPHILHAADFGFSDVDGDALTGIRLTSQPLHGRIIDIGGYIIEEDITGDGVPDVFLSAPEREIGAGEVIDLALLAGGYVRYIPAANANGLAADSFTFQVVDSGGTDPTPNTLIFDITAVDDPAIAVDDSSATVAENATTTFDVRANDSDVDGPALAVAQINGMSATVGVAITLASGATVTREADGRLTYDPNGKFDYLVSSVTAGAANALNSSASDSFTYTLVGGATATVTMTVTGVTSAGDQLWGDAGNNTIQGTPAGIVFNLGQGGDDTATGQGGNDGFYMGAELSALDVLDGGGGILDQLGLQGDYSAPFVFGANHLTEIEMLVLLSGSDARFGDTSGASYSYNLKTIDANVGTGEQLAVSFNLLLAGENVTFDGSDESDGWFLTFGGLGNDTLIGGDQDDRFYFGNNGRWGAGDSVDGGAGTLDQLGLQGSYTVTFGAGQMAGIEMLVLLTGGDTRFGNPAGTGYSYDVTMDDGNVGNGQMFYVSANTLRAGVPGVSDETLVFDGSAESDGRFTIYSGAGNDTLTGGDQDDTFYGAGGADTITGGSGNDWFLGGLGADTMAGGDGADTFAYTDAAQSQVGGFDRIFGFDQSVDKIDLPFAVTGFAGPPSGGPLSTATMGAQLEAAFAGLAANQAAGFFAVGGDLSGSFFVVVDANGTAGFQAGSDFVFEFVSPTTLPIGDVGMFI